MNPYSTKTPNSNHLRKRETNEAGKVGIEDNNKYATKTPTALKDTETTKINETTVYRKAMTKWAQITYITASEHQTPGNEPLAKQKRDKNKKNELLKNSTRLRKLSRLRNPHQFKRIRRGTHPPNKQNQNKKPYEIQTKDMEVPARPKRTTPASTDTRQQHLPRRDMRARQSTNMPRTHDE
ncbi:hypothetical protein PPTG_23788 [Phytophthora nicotianae INRA-310]|uniref:Uncharacterized protein n=1 Tax=Phytophthora nicotianae (strain INRA-310) TaxID=761204 RepID=W2PRE7_PHYN3|nr:hypothetical protein PPTG_23788 [Phytophthora nicotianae INRA-310]ETN03492.1 hypothetical protein PPTG_23788 [Phytophthora nicotianae INRA-310]